MIQTLDGQKKKRGDIVFEIGVTLQGIYMPTRSTIGSSRNPLINPGKCWAERANCQKACDEKNKIKALSASAASLSLFAVNLVKK